MLQGGEDYDRDPRKHEEGLSSGPRAVRRDVLAVPRKALRCSVFRFANRDDGSGQTVRSMKETEQSATTAGLMARTGS